MDIFTSRIGYPNSIDITVKSANGDFKLFAPTWDMVMGFKRGEKSVYQYSCEYIDRLNKIDRKVFDRLFSNKDKIILACYCRAGEFCHRVLLAKYLEEHGYGVYKGEITR